MINKPRFLGAVLLAAATFGQAHVVAAASCSNGDPTTDPLYALGRTTFGSIQIGSPTGCSTTQHGLSVLPTSNGQIISGGADGLVFNNTLSGVWETTGGAYGTLVFHQGAYPGLASQAPAASPTPALVTPPTLAPITPPTPAPVTQTATDAPQCVYFCTPPTEKTPPIAQPIVPGDGTNAGLGEYKCSNPMVFGSSYAFVLYPDGTYVPYAQGKYSNGGTYSFDPNTQLVQFTGGRYEPQGLLGVYWQAGTQGGNRDMIVMWDTTSMSSDDSLYSIPAGVTTCLLGGAF